MPYTVRRLGPGDEGATSALHNRWATHPTYGATLWVSLLSGWDLPTAGRSLTNPDEPFWGAFGPGLDAFIAFAPEERRVTLLAWDFDISAARRREAREKLILAVCDEAAARNIAEIWAVYPGSRATLIGIFGIYDAQGVIWSTRTRPSGLKEVTYDVATLRAALQARWP